VNFRNKETEVLISAEEIAEKIAVAGKELSELYKGESVVVVPLLRGAFVFAADLARAMDAEIQVEFIGASSYGDATVTSGEVRLTQDTSLPLADRNVLLVEDIVDTGLTLAYIQRLILSRNPASLRTIVLLDKKIKRQVDVKLDTILFKIPDRFVFGYGLDGPGGYNRNLPDIMAIKN